MFMGPGIAGGNRPATESPLTGITHCESGAGCPRSKLRSANRFRERGNYPVNSGVETQ